VWKLLWTKWQWGGFFPPYYDFSLSVRRLQSATIIFHLSPTLHKTASLHKTHYLSSINTRISLRFEPEIPSVSVVMCSDNYTAVRFIQSSNRSWKAPNHQPVFIPDVIVCRRLSVLWSSRFLMCPCQYPESTQRQCLFSGFESVKRNLK